MNISNIAQKALRLNFIFIFLTIFVFNLNAIELKTGAPKGSKTDFKKEILGIIDIRDKGQYKTAMEMTDAMISKAIAEVESGHYYLLLELKFNLIDLIYTDENKDSIKANYLHYAPAVLNEELDFVFKLFKTKQTILNVNIPWNSYYDENLSPIMDSSILWSKWSYSKSIKEIANSIDECLAISRRLKSIGKLKPILAENKKDKGSMPDLEHLTAEHLYQLLANKNQGVNNIAYDDKELFADAKSFMTYDFRRDSITHLSQLRLGLLQIMMKSGSIAADLKRLEYANSLNRSSNEPYVSALENLLSSRIKEPESNLVLIDLAKHYMNWDKIKAIKYADDGLKRYPKFVENKLLINIKKTILAPYLSLQTENFIKPNAPFLGKLEHKNSTEIVVKAFKISSLEFENNQNKYDEGELRSKYASLMNPLFTKKIKVTDLKDYETHSSEISLPALPAGNYILIVTNNKKLKNENALIECKQIHVSNYTYKKNESALQTVNALSGEFVSLPFEIYVEEEDKMILLKKGQTDVSGMLDFKEQGIEKLNRSVLIVFNQGEFSFNQYLYGNMYENSIKADAYRVYTDRSIYRPGQTVYYKLIAYSDDKKEVLSNKDIEVLFNGNTGEVYRKTLKTNEYGSFSDSIVLPLQGFGNFYFSSIGANLYHSIQVEEYKMPKFDAEWLEIKSTYKLGDSAKIKGKAKAFAGYPIAGATVKYTVKLRQGRIEPRYYYKMMDRGQTYYLLTGETQTDAKGEFEVSVKLVAVDSINKNENYNLNYTFEADVVDINGEQHTCIKDLMVSNINRTLTLNGSENVVDGTDYALEVSHTNLQGVAIPFTGYVKLLKLKKEDQFLGVDRLWNEADTSLISKDEMSKYFAHYSTPEFNIEKELLVNKVYQNDSIKYLTLKMSELKGQGTYFIEMYSISGNDTVVAYHQFMVSPAKEEPYLMNAALMTYVVEGTEFEPGEEVKLAVLSKFKSGVLHLEVLNKEGIKLKRVLVLDGNVKIIKIPVTNDDRGGFKVKVNMIHDYRFYQDFTNVDVPYSNKKLKLSIQSFRTDLEPGSKEKWTLNVQCPKEECTLIENAAVMYDAALDDLGAGTNDWYLDAFSNFYSYENYENALISEESEDLSFHPYYDLDDLSQKRFSRPFTESDISDRINGYVYLWSFGNGAVERGNEMASGMYRYQTKVLYDADFDAVPDSHSWGFSNRADDALETSPAPTAPEIKARKILKELAFFKSVVYADKKGDFNLEFT
ncbi:MAG TPA: MG2 domain-containing protein, partial [Bacteroidia bacterium]